VRLRAKECAREKGGGFSHRRENGPTAGFFGSGVSRDAVLAKSRNCSFRISAARLRG
jgi:hypothetical protein